MHKFVEVSEFEKDLHKLKKFRTIQEDVERFEKILDVEGPENLTGAVVISNLGKGILPVYKAKKFRCKALQSVRDMRVIYTYNPSTNEIILIEIYHKGKKENHDVARIRKYAIKV